MQPYFGGEGGGCFQSGNKRIIVNKIALINSYALLKLRLERGVVLESRGNNSSSSSSSKDVVALQRAMMCRPEGEKSRCAFNSCWRDENSLSVLAASPSSVAAGDEGARKTLTLSTKWQSIFSLNNVPYFILPFPETPIPPKNHFKRDKLSLGVLPVFDSLVSSFIFAVLHSGFFSFFGPERKGNNIYRRLWRWIRERGREEDESLILWRLK